MYAHFVFYLKTYFLMLKSWHFCSLVFRLALYEINQHKPWGNWTIFRLPSFCMNSGKCIHKMYNLAWWLDTKVHYFCNIMWSTSIFYFEWNSFIDFQMNTQLRSGGQSAFSSFGWRGRTRWSWGVLSPKSLNSSQQ